MLEPNAVLLEVAQDAFFPTQGLTSSKAKVCFLAAKHKPCSRQQESHEPPALLAQRPEGTELL